MKTSDGIIIKTDKKLAMMSMTIKHQLNEQQGEDNIVAVPKVNSTTLKKVLEWCNAHKDDIQPSDFDELQFPIMTEKDERILDINSVLLKDVVSAAVHLKIPVLLRFGIRKSLRE